jgi:hypothetical protein
MSQGFAPLGPDGRSLLEQVRTIWEKGLHKLPVHKDLPRLAGGFEIADGNTKRMVRRRTMLTSIADLSRAVRSIKSRAGRRLVLLLAWTSFGA